MTYTEEFLRELERELRHDIYETTNEKEDDEEEKD